MNYDILNRIKEIKRELLDLKTAHLHGLGSFKVYKQTITVPKGSNWGNYYTGNLKIEIKRNSESQFFPPLVSIASSFSIGATTIDGTLNGDTLTVMYNDFYPGGVSGNIGVIVYSTSPVSLSYTVSDLKGF